MHLFYAPDIRKQLYQLQEEESKHAIRVLRLSQGDHIQLIDGRGGFYTAEIISPHPRQCEVKVLEKIEHYGKRPYSVHLAVAPTKNIERMEWLFEKATEIGVDEISPLLTEHSERKVIKDERLERIITSAVKQSLKAYHPVLHPMRPLAEFLAQPHTGAKYIAHLEESQRQLLVRLAQPRGKYLILIGPEGDFSPTEVQQVLAHGFQPVSLGDARLRTETAALAAVHTFALVNQLQA